MAAIRAWDLSGQTTSPGGSAGATTVTGTDYPQVGDWVVFAAAVDNVTASTPTISDTNLPNCNSSTFVKGVVNSPTASGNAGTIIVYCYAKVSTNWTGSTTISVTLSNSISAKAAGALCISGSFDEPNIVVVDAQSATGAGNKTVSHTIDADAGIIAFWGSETSTALTDPANRDRMVRINTASGGSAANQAVLGIGDVNTTGSAYVGNWAVSTSDGGCFGLYFPVAVTLTPVSNTRSTTWNTLKQETGTRSSSWNVIGRITATLATTWNALASISASRSTTWHVLTPVAASTRSTTWHVLAQIIATRNSTWNTFASVVGTRSTTWNTASRVTATRSTTWDTLARVGGFDVNGVTKYLWLAAADQTGANGSTVTDWENRVDASFSPTFFSNATNVTGATPSGGRLVRVTGGTISGFPSPPWVTYSMQVTASSYYVPLNLTGQRAADGDISTDGWNSAASTGPPQWLRFQPAAGTVATSYKIWPFATTKAPRDWTFEGSNDGSSWTTLDTRSSVTAWTTSVPQTFSFSNSTAYTYYRISISANNGSSEVAIQEFQINNVSNTVTNQPAELLMIVDSNDTSGNAWKFGTNGSQNHYTFGSDVYTDFGNGTRRNYTPSPAVSSLRLLRSRIDSSGNLGEWVDETQQLNVTGVTRSWHSAPWLASGWSGDFVEIMMLPPTDAPTLAGLIGYFNTTHGMSIPGGSGGSQSPQRATTWNTLSQVSATRSTTWNVAADLTPVSNTRSTTWNTLATVTGTRSSSWHTLTQITGTRSSTWHALATVTGTRSSTWNVGFTVAGTRSTTWNVLSGVSATRSTTWHALARVTGTRSTLWNTSARVTGSRATTWDALSRTTGTRSTTWNVVARVTATRSTTWNVASALTSVSNSRSSTWRVLATVTGTRSTTWNTRARITSTLATSWDVLTQVTAATRSTTWAVLSAVTATRSTTWRVLAAITASRSSTWHVLVRVTGTVSTTWQVFDTQPVSASRSTSWHVRVQVTATRSTTWNVASLLPPQLFDPYDTHVVDIRVGVVRYVTGIDYRRRHVVVNPHPIFHITGLPTTFHVTEFDYA